MFKDIKKNPSVCQKCCTFNKRKKKYNLIPQPGPSLKKHVFHVVSWVIVSADVKFCCRDNLTSKRLFNYKEKESTLYVFYECRSSTSKSDTLHTRTMYLNNPTTITNVLLQPHWCDFEYHRQTRFRKWTGVFFLSGHLQLHNISHCFLLFSEQQKSCFLPSSFL